jgi:hypothetical protein|tara:strand:- start:299 stop:907 length:609 start_codon:yes stop_codon:yes gene_type:complete
MAGIVDVNFKVTEACDNKSILFQELTGAYSALNNLGGWGTPNYLLGNVLDVEIVITMPSGATIILDAATLTPTLPSDSNGIFHIHMGLLGGTQGATIAQGIYQIEYRILVDDGTAQGFLISKRKFALVASVIKCCVHKMLANLDMCDACPCGEDKSNALEAYTLYKAMWYAYTCGSTTKAAKMANQVNKLCNYRSTCASCTS